MGLAHCPIPLPASETPAFLAAGIFEFEFPSGDGAAEQGLEAAQEVVHQQ